MTLDEAIERAKEAARAIENDQSAAKYIQLTEWLRQARGADKAARWYMEKIRKLKEENDKLRWKLEVLKAHGIEIVDAVAGGYEIYSDDHKEAERLMTENAKLRKELAKACDPQRIGGQADPSSFVYAIEQLREFRWQHATNDEDAIPYINNVAAAHERENAKLRELLHRLLTEYRYMRARPRRVYLQHERRMRAIEEEMRNLGIEVDDGKTDHM